MRILISTILIVFDSCVNLMNAFFLAIADNAIYLGEQFFDFAIDVEDKFLSYFK